MKPFNLEEAKAGKPICTRDGDKARVICFDVQGRMPPLAALITDLDGDEYVSLHREDGTSVHNPDEDLFMAPSIQCWWVAVYALPNGDMEVGKRLYPTRDAALKYSCVIGRVGVTKVEWEE